jgi:hypothetical protein
MWREYETFNVMAPVTEGEGRNHWWKRYSAGHTEDVPARGYACPFRKYDPVYYNAGSHPACAYESFFYMPALL